MKAIAIKANWPLASGRAIATQVEIPIEAPSRGKNANMQASPKAIISAKCPNSGIISDYCPWFYLRIDNNGSILDLLI